MAENKKAVVEYRSQGGVDIILSPDVVRNFLVQGKKELVSAQELMYFMNVCRARKLNPFIKDCYLIKFGGDPAAIVTSVDYFRKNARKAPDCKGWKSGIVILKDGEITYREGSLILDDETLVGGWAEAKPEGWHEPKKHTINLAGYIKKTKSGDVTRFWHPDKQPDMIAKVAESQLLRQLWGEETTGMYSAEEMPTIEDAKDFGPVQSDIKQRIMDGKKKADPDPEPELSETTVVDAEYPPDAQAAAERNAKRVADRNAERAKAKAKPPKPDVDPPITEDLTEDQIIATEKTFQMLCKTVKISDADANRYLENLKENIGLKYIDVMRVVIENPKTEFQLMTDWLQKQKIDEQSAPVNETKAVKKKNGKKEFAAPDIRYNNEKWNPENWFKKRKSGFSTYVWKNVALLNDEPDPLIAAVQAKWKKFYREPFPKAEDATLNGKANGVTHIETETYYEPPKDEPATPAPDKENDPVEYVKWLKGDFPDEYKGALEYLGFADTPATLSKDAVERLIKSTEQLIDMNA